MVTINFYTLGDKIPNYGEEIIFLRRFSCFDNWGFEPQETTVDYCWFTYDKEGFHTGEQILYDPETDLNFHVGDCKPGYDSNEYLKLEVMFNEYCVTEGEETEPTFLWIPIEEYWKCFENNVSKG